MEILLATANARRLPLGQLCRPRDCPTLDLLDGWEGSLWNIEALGLLSFDLLFKRRSLLEFLRALLEAMRCIHILLLTISLLEFD